MANLKLVKSATALVLGASVLTSAVVASGTDASAKTTYKVTKKGTLVNAKTNKAVKGYKSYKGKLYKNGKKFTGTYKSVFYKSGAKFTGTYNKKYYVKGKLFTGKTSKNVYYKKGVKFTGVTSYGYTYKDGKRVEGEYKGKVYKNGKLVTGLYKDVLYKKGVKETGLDLYKGKLYNEGVLNVGLALFEEKLYNNADLATGIFTYNGVEDQYKDGVVVPTKVESASAVNPKTVTLTGTNLKKVTKDDVTIEGTKVTDLKVSDDRTTATLTLETPINENQDYKVSVKTPTGTQDLTLKYTFNLGEVAVTTTTLEANKDKQFLTLSLNGVATDLAQVEDTLGYKVEFQADKAVFKTAAAASNVSTTGEIDETAAATALNKSFDVKVVLKKDGKTVESKTVTVKVVSAATPAIGNIVLTTDELGELSAATISTKDTDIKLDHVLSNTGDIIKVSGLSSFASSNPAVATIDASSGAITPIKAGKTTITVTAGKVSYSKEITVVDTARVATKATPKNATVSVAPGASFTNNVTVTDQFGEVLDLSKIKAVGLTPTIAATEKTGNTNVSAVDATVDGILPVTVAPAANAIAGTYTVYVQDLETAKNIGQFTVKVTNDNVADNYKLEVVDSSKGTINIATSAKTLTLNANEFTKTGGFLRSLQSGDADASSFTVESANPKVATVDTAPDATGNIVVTGVKAGSTQIILKKGGVQVATATVTVINQVPTIQSIAWKNKDAITIVGKKLTYKDIFTITDAGSAADPIVEGVKLSVDTTSKVRIDLTDTSAPVLYLDINDDGKYVAGEDEILGTVSATVSGSVGETITLGSPQDWTATGNILGQATASKDKGTLVIKVKDDDTNTTVVESSTISVDVK
ncbi:Ig-like domain-containing protein [Rummeliibacillus sp. TYF005]|uniref:Ig-like domain-containing protein n=1 Tax=Rummeliibacillus sp. TYF005 TaxID=2058214 RepID=UPI0013DD98D5|nr:Ig-like domain-containing protein [Rummeliibacillus sp. TYF005]